MTVNLNDTPVTNSLMTGIILQLNGNPVANINSGAASVLTLTFDEVLMANAIVPHPFTQNPNVPVTVHPGNFALFQPIVGGVGLTYQMPHGAAQLVRFT